MAQMGCFVPADFATFRLADKVWRTQCIVRFVDVRSSCARTPTKCSCQLFTRLSLDDRIEANASSFLLEVRGI